MNLPPEICPPAAGLRTISILCAAQASAYATLPGVVVYTRHQDAFTFPGHTPIVAHPHCRSWSAFTRHQAKPDPSEQSLAFFCADKLRHCGGVLEQPAHSLLWHAAGFPLPGHHAGNLWSIGIWQCWFGYPMRKATWLCFSAVPRSAVSLPFCLWPHGADRRTEQRMSHRARSATTPSLAAWLVTAARASAL